MKKEKKNPAIMVIVLGFLILLQIKLSAQTDSLKNYNLDDVIISATRSEKPVFDVGRSVSIISKEDINNSVYLSPSEALSSREGINIIGTGQNPGSLQNIYMRGSNTNHTTIMIDGLRITDPSSVDNSLDLAELSLANIQRIEIVRGSHSTLYGSSAIGGVINFITEKNMKPGLNADLNLQTGTFGEGSFDFTQNLLLNYTTHEGFYFSGEVYNSNVKGFDATVKNTPPVFGSYDKDNFDKTDIFGKAGYAANNLDLFIAYKRTDQKEDIDDGAFADDDNYILEFKRNLFSYGFSYKANSYLDFTVNGGFSDMERLNLDDSSVVDDLGNTDGTYYEAAYSGSVFNNEIQANLKLDNITAVIGGGIYTEKMNNTFYSVSQYGLYEQDLDSLNIKTDTKNIFAHVDVNGALFSSSLSPFAIGLGTRYNSHSTFGNKVTYEINPTYKLTENTLLYGSLSTAFNAPPLYRLFTPESNYLSGITRGNKNLKPEYSKSFEIGLKQKYGSVTFTLAAFTTEVENNIEYVYLWDPNIPIDELGNDWMRDDNRGDTYLNIGTLFTKGLEVSLASNITTELSASINYSFVDGNIEYKPSDIDNEATQGNHVQLYNNGAFVNRELEQDNLVRRANTATLSIQYQPLDKLDLILNVKYIGKKDDIFYDGTILPWGALGTEPVQEYTLFDISAKYQLLQNFAALIKIENIFDKQYSEIKGYRSRGRGVYLSLRYSLQ